MPWSQMPKKVFTVYKLQDYTYIEKIPPLPCPPLREIGKIDWVIKVNLTLARISEDFDWQRNSQPTKLGQKAFKIGKAKL